MNLYTDWYDYVLMDVPGCLPAVASQAIKLAVIDFCKKTGFWRYKLADMNVVVDESYTAADLNGFGDNVTGGSFTLTATSAGDSLAHYVTVMNNSTTNHSAKTIALVGTGYLGEPITETINAPNASQTVQSTLLFKTLTSATPSATIGSDTFDIGWATGLTSEYVLTPPPNTEIHELKQVNYSRSPSTLGTGRELIVVPPTDLAGIYSDWEAEEADEPDYATMQARNIMRLVPEPQVAVTGGLRNIWVTLKPTMDSTSVSNEKIFDHYAEEIAMGAKSRLQMSPNKPYTDLNAAGINKGLFDMFTLRIASKVRAGFVDQSISIGEPLA